MKEMLRQVGLGVGREKLLVEFDVERTVKREYGYEEKFLAYKGRSVPFKAILRKGRFVTIVSRQYVLIPNEVVAEAVKKLGYAVEKERDDGVKYYAILRVGSDLGVLVRNSIDGSWALRVDLVWMPSGNRAIVKVRRRVEQVYRKHVGGISEFVGQLADVVRQVAEVGKEFKELLRKADDVRLERSDVDVLEDVLPKKYVVGLRGLAFKGASFRKAYEVVARRIWLSATASMDRKIELYDKLNQVLFMKLEVEGI